METTLMGSSGQISFLVFILNCSPRLASLSFDSSLSGCINCLSWEQALKSDLLASNLLRMNFQEKPASGSREKANQTKPQGGQGNVRQWTISHISHWLRSFGSLSMWGKETKSSPLEEETHWKKGSREGGTGPTEMMKGIRICTECSLPCLPGSLPFITSSRSTHSWDPFILASTLKQCSLARHTLAQ